MKDYIKFFEYFAKMELMGRIGISKILGVRAVEFDSDKKMRLRQAEEWLSDLSTAFNALPRRRRRTLLKIMKEAVKK